MKNILSLFFLSFLFQFSVIAQSTNLAIYQIFQNKCISCHGDIAPEGQLNLIGNGASLEEKAMAVFTNLYEATPINIFANDQGYQRIYPGRLDKSHLYRKITPDFDPYIELDNAEENDVHATLDPALSIEEKELIRQWILFGAPSEGIVVDEQLIADYYDGNGTMSFPEGPPPAPSMDEGFQIRMGPFYMEPGGEVEYFQKFELDLPADVDVNRLDIKISGSSHHFLLYKYDEGGAENTNPGLQEDVEHSDISLVVSAGQAKNIELPQGTAFKWKGDDVLSLNSHYINYSTTQVYQSEVYLNIYTQAAGTAIQEMRSSLIPNTAIYIPNTGEEVNFTDVFIYPEAEIFVWKMGGHTHKYGTGYKIYDRLENGDYGELLYDGSCPLGVPGCVVPTFDYQHIPSRSFDSLLPLDLNSGIIHEATYINDGDEPVWWGSTSADEMMLLGIMYVVDSTGLNIGMTTDVEEQQFDNNPLEIFPNPMTDYTMIKLPDSNSQSNLILYDLWGREIQRINAISNHSIRIERENLSSGLYYLKIEDLNGKTYMGKIVVK